MAEIHVDIAALEGKIQKLRALATACEAVNVTPEAVVGSGKVIDMLTTVDETYTDVKAALLQLINNSTGFFEGVRLSMTEADEKASKKIGSGGGHTNLSAAKVQ